MTTDLTREQYAAIMQRVATLGVEEALARLDTPRRRTRTPWARKEVIDAYSMKLLTRAEARRLLGVRDTGRRAPS